MTSAAAAADDDDADDSGGGGGDDDGSEGGGSGSGGSDCGRDMRSRRTKREIGKEGYVQQVSGCLLMHWLRSKAAITFSFMQCTTEEVLTHVLGSRWHDQRPCGEPPVGAAVEHVEVERTFPAKHHIHIIQDILYENKMQ